LLDYDRKKGTELVRTLEAFLDCGQNIQKAAFLLNIHPKTLQYRLGSIKSLLSIEMMAGEQQLILHIGCKMLKLLQIT
jgi:DNA-binding PucR family transcriptional regulator